MSNKKNKKLKIKKPRDWQAIEAHFKTGAGGHGGSVKEKNKKDRKTSNEKLKNINNIFNSSPTNIMEV